jgi:hypothetical protein
VRVQRVLKVESEVESGLAAVAHDAVGKLIWSPAVPVVASRARGGEILRRQNTRFVGGLLKKATAMANTCRAGNELLCARKLNFSQSA